MIRSFSKDSDSSGLKPSPSSVLEFVEDVQTTLHHLVSEGDTEGVRLGQSLCGRHACMHTHTLTKHSYICSYMHPSIDTCTDKHIQSIICVYWNFRFSPEIFTFLLCLKRCRWAYMCVCVFSLKVLVWRQMLWPICRLDSNHILLIFASQWGFPRSNIMYYKKSNNKHAYI